MRVRRVWISGVVRGGCERVKMMWKKDRKQSVINVKH